MRVASQVLTRPFVLLEIYTALKLGIPVVPVVISEEDHPGHGYDFDEAKSLLANLSRALEGRNPGAIGLMNEHLAAYEETVEHVSALLADTLPNIISIMLAPSGTTNHWNAVLADVLDKISIQQRAMSREATSQRVAVTSVGRSRPPPAPPPSEPARPLPSLPSAKPLPPPAAPPRALSSEPTADGPASVTHGVELTVHAPRDEAGMEAGDERGSV